MLSRSTLYYIVLYHTTLYYLILPYTISYYLVLTHIISYYLVLSRTISYYLILPYISSTSLYYIILSHIISLAHTFGTMYQARGLVCEGEVAFHCRVSQNWYSVVYMHFSIFFIFQYELKFIVPLPYKLIMPATL